MTSLNLEKRTETAHVKLSVSELEQVRSDAEKNGMSLPEYIRYLIVKARKN